MPVLDASTVFNIRLDAAFDRDPVKIGQKQDSAQSERVQLCSQN
jgi:hypothetical protein